MQIFIDQLTLDCWLGEACCVDGVQSSSCITKNSLKEKRWCSENETNLVGCETFLGTETLFARRKIKLCEDE